MASHSSTSSFNEQKIFFKKLLIFIVLVIILDQALGRQLEHVFYNLRSGRFGVINLAVDTKADILILGDSKAHHNYIPRLIRDNLDLSCYNLGADGMNVIYHYILVNHIINYYRPTLIIYDVSGKEFNDKYFDPSKFSILMPYAKNCRSALDIIKKEDSFIDIKLLSRLYPFNQNLHSIFLHGLIAPRITKGYEPLHGTDLVKELKNKKNGTSSKIDENDILKFAFKALLDIVAEQKIPIVLINSPVWDFDDYYRLYNFPQNILNTLKGYEAELFIIQKDKYPQLNEEWLFKDSSHLNHHGAIIFSKIVNAYLHQLKSNNYF
jgi:hypothetical protein